MSCIYGLEDTARAQGIPLHKDGPQCTVASNEWILLNDGQILKSRKLVTGLHEWEWYAYCPPCHMSLTFVFSFLIKLH